MSHNPKLNWLSSLHSTSQQLLQRFQSANIQQQGGGGGSAGPPGGIPDINSSMDTFMTDQILQQYYSSSQPVRLQNPTSYHVQQTFSKTVDPTILMGLGPDDPPIKQEMEDLMDPFNTLVDEFGSSSFTAGAFGEQQLSQTGLLLPTTLLSPLSSHSPLDPDDLDPLVDGYQTPHNSESQNNSYSTTPATSATSSNNKHIDHKPSPSPAKTSTRSNSNQYIYSYSLPTTSSTASVPSSTRNSNSHPNSFIGGHPASFGSFGTGIRVPAQPSASVSDFASVAGTSYGDDESDTSVAAGSNSRPSTRLDANEKRRRRRESHNAVERRRRDNINEKIQELATLLPEYINLQSEGAPKLNKGAILRRSVDYMRHIVGVAHRLADRNRELEVVFKRICVEANIPESSLGLSLPLGTNLFDPGLPSVNGMNMDD